MISIRRAQSWTNQIVEGILEYVLNVFVFQEVLCAWNLPLPMVARNDSSLQPFGDWSSDGSGGLEVDQSVEIFARAHVMGIPDIDTMHMIHSKRSGCRLSCQRKSREPVKISILQSVFGMECCAVTN